MYLKTRKKGKKPTKTKDLYICVILKSGLNTHKNTNTEVKSIKKIKKV